MAKSITVYVKGTDDILTYSDANGREDSGDLLVERDGQTIARFQLRELKHWHPESH